MVSELAGEGAMPLPKPASHAELQVRLRRQIRFSLRRGVFPAKTVALFNPSTMFIPLSLDGSSRSRSVEITSRVLVNPLFAVFNRSSRSRSVRSSAELVIPISSRVLVSSLFTVFIRSRSAKVSSAELVAVVSLPQRRTRKKKPFINPIRDLASKNSQAERRVSDLKNRVGKLRSEIEIEATIANIEEASHSNDLAAAIKCLQDSFVDVNFVGDVCLDVFPVQLLSRETMDGIQGNGNLYAGSAVGYGTVPLSGNQIAEPLFPMNCSSSIESFPAKNVMKSDSGLTYGLPQSRKRSREEANPLISYPAFQNTSNRCGSFSFLGEDISLQIQQQYLEDRLKETEAELSALKNSKALSTSRDIHHGGDDFDKKIVDWLASNFKKDEGIDLKDIQALQCLIRDEKAIGRSSQQSEPSASVELNSRNFDDLVVKSKDLWIVEFFAPWCGLCKKLAPEWKNASKSLKGKVNLGHYCDAEKSLMNRFSVQGFPRALVFGADKDHHVPYNGARTASAIESFALEQLGINISPPEVTELTGAVDLLEVLIPIGPSSHDIEVVEQNYENIEVVEQDYEKEKTNERIANYQVLLSLTACTLSSQISGSSTVPMFPLGAMAYNMHLGFVCCSSRKIHVHNEQVSLMHTTADGGIPVQAEATTCLSHFHFKLNIPKICMSSLRGGVGG